MPTPLERMLRMAASPAPPDRFVAIVVRAHDVLLGAVGAERQVALAPRRMALEGLPARLRQLLGPADAVVIASRANAWQLHDSLAPLVAAIIIAQPQVET